MCVGGGNETQINILYNQTLKSGLFGIESGELYFQPVDSWGPKGLAVVGNGLVDFAGKALEAIGREQGLTYETTWVRNESMEVTSTRA